MTVEERRITAAGEDEPSKDRFPVGMRVLAVDDDPTCLRLLESLLRRCKYHVTTTSQAIMALKLLRENKNKFDLVISDVQMPDMDGFKLLELVGLEMDLPVIMMSANGDTNLVMKGITHGACDYLLKPIRIEELRNIWQHVIRRRKFDLKDHNNSDNQDKPQHGTGEGGQGHTVTGNADRNGKLNRKRKDQDDDDDDDSDENGYENEDPSSQKKPRVVWSVELHRKFVAAVNQLGIDKAVPKKILDLMNVEKLTRENVASHLQKYRLYLKRISCVASQQANMVAALGGKDSSYLRMNGLDRIGDFHALTGSRQSPNTALTSFAHGGMLSRLNSPAGLGMRGLPSSGIIQLGHTQNSSNSVNDFGKLHQMALNGNQNGSLLQGIPTSLEPDQLQQSKFISHTGESSATVSDPTVFQVASSFLDPGVTIGSSSNSFQNVTSNPLMLQGQAQQTQNRGGLGNHSSVGMASLNLDPFDLGVNVSSQAPDLTRCNENWQSAIPLSGFPSNPLPLSDSFNHSDLPPSNLRDNICSVSPHTGSNTLDVSFTRSASAHLQDSRRDIQSQAGPIGNTFQHGNQKSSNFGSMNKNVGQNISYAPKQRWEGDQQDYAHNSNLIYSSLNSPVPTHGVLGPLSHSLEQNNTVCSKKMDVTLIGQSHCGAPFLMQQNEAETVMRLKEDYIMGQTKSHDRYPSNSCSSLEDIMNAMIKREQEEMTIMEGDFGSHVFTPGPCL